MGPLILAWLIGEGIIVWRAAVKEHQAPVPGAMLAATGLFAAAALLAEYQPARKAAITFAYGVDLAVLMQVLPGMKETKTKTPAKGKAGKGKAAPAATSTAGATS